MTETNTTTMAQQQKQQQQQRRRRSTSSRLDESSLAGVAKQRRTSHQGIISSSSPPWEAATTSSALQEGGDDVYAALSSSSPVPRHPSVASIVSTASSSGEFHEIAISSSSQDSSNHNNNHRRQSRSSGSSILGEAARRLSGILPPLDQVVGGGGGGSPSGVKKTRKKRGYQQVRQESQGGSSSILDVGGGGYISPGEDDDEEPNNDDDDIHNNIDYFSTTNNNKTSKVVGCIRSIMASYIHVWRKYPYYRLFFLSHLCQNMGDWFVRIASLLFVQRYATKQGAGLSHLVLANVLPKAFFSQLGGIMADRYDRRRIMIALDCSSGFITLGFLASIYYESLPLLYLVSTLRSVMGSLYYPASTGMVALLVHDPKDLLLANTMNSWAWSTMAILGGVLAGSLGAIIGEGMCYVVDAVTFFISAFVVMQIRGSYRVNRMTTGQDGFGGRDVVGGVPGCDHHHQGPVMGTSSATAPDSAPAPGHYNKKRSGTDDDDMFHEGNAVAVAVVGGGDGPSSSSSSSCQRGTSEFFHYLLTCGFTFVTLLKATAALIWGPEDIVSTAFAKSLTEEGTSVRMGLTFSFIGMGCFTGPTVANLFTDPTRPVTLQRACVCAMLVQVTSWFIMWRADVYPLFLLATFVRAMGSSTIWVNSTLLLQTLSVPSMLGKVLAVEYMSYTIFESISATAAGKLEDGGVDKNHIALFAGFMACVAAGIWLWYTFVIRGGAAGSQFQPPPHARSGRNVSTSRRFSSRDGGGILGGSMVELPGIKEGPHGPGAEEPIMRLGMEEDSGGIV